MITSPTLLRAACIFFTTLSLSFPARADQAIQRAHVRHQAYELEYLASNGGVIANYVDPDLVSPWGLAFDPAGYAWVANHGSGKVTLYDGSGALHPQLAGIPPISFVLGTEVPPFGELTSTPTGVAYTGATARAREGDDFSFCNIHASCGVAKFVFVDEGGLISIWDRPPATSTETMGIYLDETAVYKGVAVGTQGTARRIYATDFRNRRIEVLGSDATGVPFMSVRRTGAFEDPRIPLSYSPFGIGNINGDIYVTYARQDANAHDPVPGAGFGYISVFDAEGNLIRRLVSRGALNAPWGLTLAPTSFGKWGGTLLVSNVGDGTINAYSLRSGLFLGPLRDDRHRRLRIEGLRAIQFGNGLQSQPTNDLFFTAAPGAGSQGAYGVIRAVTTQ